MVTYNTLTIENQNAIVEKAKVKSDGIYTFRGILYKVQNGKVIVVACNGEILQPFGHFVVNVGKYENTKVAKDLLKSYGY